MEAATNFRIFVLLATIIYFGASKVVFDKVFESSKVVIDELFHVPQGLAYCGRNFSYWDPKITTLPGLYLVSATFLGSYLPCNLYNLRFINVVASTVNFLLFISILKFVYGSAWESQLKVIIQAFNLAILPPLYFFSHVYYTDTLSLTFLLAFFRLCFVNKHKLLILMFGLGSVLMRQTNIIWIAMVFGHKLLDIFVKSSRVFGNQYITNITLSKYSAISKDVDNSKLRRYYSLSDVIVAIKYHLRTFFTTFFPFLTLHDLSILLTHLTVLLSFILFVYYNGSIVVGDKKAHEATAHVPQIFYFLIFYGFFGLPYVLAKLPSTFNLILRNKTNFFILTVFMLLAVHYNTVIHPYLLADNRHYTFYIWNRWFGKYDFAVHATVPLYVFLYFSLYDNLKDQNCVTFLLPYTVATFLVLCLQRMIEVRYFLVPYLILRLRFVRPSYNIVFAEFIWYILLNVITFKVFFEKEIFWKDFDYAQRIIW